AAGGPGFCRPAADVPPCGRMRSAGRRQRGLCRPPPCRRRARAFGACARPRARVPAGAAHVRPCRRRVRPDHRRRRRARPRRVSLGRGMTGTAAAPEGWTDSPRLGVALVAFSAVLFGLVPYFARSLTEAGIAPPAVAFFRYMFPAVAFLPFLRLRGAMGRASLWGYCAGFCVGLGW